MAGILETLGLRRNLPQAGAVSEKPKKKIRAPLPPEVLGTGLAAKAGTAIQKRKAMLDAL